MPVRDHESELTPAMRDVLRRIARAGRAPLHSLPVREARLAYAAGAEVLDFARAPLPRVADLQIPARDGALLGARLYAPSADAKPLPALLFMHGGGFTLGGIETHDSLCRQLALRSGAAVVSLDYRLAPEHRFPVAVNDTWDALQWLAAQGGRLGLDPARLALGGDSAGATLAAVAALMARDAGLPLSLQLLFYPGTTARQSTDSYLRYEGGPLIDAPLIQWFFANYIDESEREDWRFAPLLADDFEGVASAWIGLAEVDPMVDEGVAYGDRLRMQGVDVELEIWRGVVHEFIKMGRAIPQAAQALDSAAGALKRAFA
ncbi:MAG TPA: alpha/beta hydrolase [Burkholderiaceae bacterium]|jgi:acetyl esterase|nr:alpha/beta hydrolase [Burkholderiaceae bacterium]